ncbi:MBL fold metallo-hydrolase [Halorubrum sp. SD626R]|uniref:MBL fold metallo-hydrolase n=1 Tax=Halorubrum TaxID=56688 RepID=UPI0010F441B1|nr:MULTISPECIES: MBL fold metallo-hydrolase [Halorubrum]TKX78551.1 MBL fold metallo-hydrolase [Halorubrum sp. SD626R]
MHRIQLGNTVFEGANNVYLLDGPTTALVDTGVALPDVRDELRSGLADHGVAFGDVDEVVVTHWHPDHAGLAGEIQDESGADVFVHASDAPLVDGSVPPLMADADLQRETFEAWGLPDDAREELTDFFASVSADISGPPADVTTLSDGDELTVGGVTLEAVHLPGHTAGLTGFAFDLPVGDSTAETASEGLFSADAVLPTYTPNVGGADVRVDEPLAAYARSLVRVIERDFAVAYPGHRDRIDEPSMRAATILEHHRTRTRRVVDALAEVGPATPWEVSAELFGALSEIHILHGPGEAFAHLDHLAAAGVTERDGGRYRLVDPDVDVDSLFPATGLERTLPDADDE